MLICTALKATTSVLASIASASRDGSTVVTVTPRASCTRNGNSVEVNSTSGTSTRVPAGRLAAARPMKADTVAPIATRSGATPTIVAKAARDPSVLSPQCSQLVRPVRHSASACCSASKPSRGGRPKLAVLR